MADRQTRNVSLPPHQDAFVQATVEGGRFRTASEVFREGLRLLEESEHRRLLEKWLCEGLSPEDESRLPDSVRERARSLLRDLVEKATEDVEGGRVAEGPTAMQRLRERLEARLD